MDKTSQSGPRLVQDGQSSPDGSGARVRELRTCLSQIVTTCELLKLEAGPQAARGLVEKIDEIRALAIAVTDDLRGASSRSSDVLRQHGLREAIAATARSISQVLQQVSRLSAALPRFQASDDFLRVEFMTHRLAQLADEFPSAADDGAPIPPRPAEDPAAAPAPAPEIAPAASVSSRHLSGDRQVVLVVDDDQQNREILNRFLRSEGQQIILAASGQEALQTIHDHRIDLLLLDLLMPGIDGLGVLRTIRAGDQMRQVPVIMISGVDEIERVAACIEAGADDYVLKPFNPTLLRARVRSLLERKHLHDLEQARTEQLEQTLRELEEQKKTTERLLLNILPQKVAAELTVHGSVSPSYFEDATVVFTDFVSFTSSTEKLAADELVAELGFYFTAFDNIMDRYGLEKLKTVGDSYIFLAGVPERTPSHPVDAVLASLEMLACVKSRQGHPLSGWPMRIGINTGPVISGVVGTRKFAFDVWGDSVNFASRMVSSGAADRINLSARTFHRIKDFFLCAPRGEVKIKGNRWVEMYFLEGVLPNLLADTSAFPPPAFRERYRKYFQKDLEIFPELPAGGVHP